jgi:hypothetical protein
LVVEEKPTEIDLDSDSSEDENPGNGSSSGINNGEYDQLFDI